jgi:hypothetical protein
MVRGAEARAPEESVPRAFLREAAFGVAGIGPEDLDPGNLTIPLEVSRWLVRGDVDLAQACEAMLALRSAFLRASGLDRSSEPVPLLGGDRKGSVLTMAFYLDGLMDRGARLAGTTRAALAEAALALLDD